MRSPLMPPFSVSKRTLDVTSVSRIGEADTEKRNL
jgi:hypothetical protein